VKRLSTCPLCSQENRDDAKFCAKCGSQLEAPSQPAPPPQQAEAPIAGAGEAPPPPPPPQAMAPPQPPSQAPPLPPPQAAPTVSQPVAPSAYPPPAPPGGYAPTQQQYAPRAAAYPAAGAAYATGTKTKGIAFWIGAAIVLISGALVLISSFLTWFTGPFGFGSFKGWDLVNLIDNKFFDYGSGYPMFTGLCSLIAGGLIVLIALLMLVSRSKGLAVLAIIFSILALGMAVTNLTSILRGPEGMSLNAGIGMYLFLAFSFLGIVGGGTAMAG
jgi:hypothetical protein